MMSFTPWEWVLAGIAGIVYASNIRAADANAAGQFIELYAILAVVLGGTSLAGGKFSIAGTVVGVLIIQTLNSTILFLGVPPAQSPRPCGPPFRIRARRRCRRGGSPPRRRSQARHRARAIRVWA